MSKIPTTAIVYVSADGSRRIGAKEFQEMAASKAVELRDMKGYFSEYLEYVPVLTSEEIFRLTEEEKARLWREYEEQCVKDAEEELLRSAWSKQLVEVEIEVED